MNYVEARISDLVGKVFNQVYRDGDKIRFVSTTETYQLYHQQDCCEEVIIESITGDLSDLEGSPITLAEEVSKDTGALSRSETQTWTFYKFATIKGYVDMRWYGTSNGYYSEEVDFVLVKPDPEMAYTTAYVHRPSIDDTHRKVLLTIEDGLVASAEYIEGGRVPPGMPIKQKEVVEYRIGMGIPEGWTKFTTKQEAIDF